MAGRKRRRRRRRRGDLSFLYKLVTFFVICGAIVAALAVFFKVDTIEVTGNSRYSAQEVLDSAGLSVGDNMFLLNKYDAAAKITKELPYVSAVRISRRLPDTLVLEVEEIQQPAALETADGVWLVSAGGKVLEQTDAVPEGTVRLAGLTPVSPETGQTLTVEAGQEKALEMALAILRHLRDKSVLEKCQSVDVSDPSVIAMEYDGRFRVLIPWEGDTSYKLDCMLTVIDTKLEDNERGTLDLTREAVHFIPG